MKTMWSGTVVGVACVVAGAANVWAGPLQQGDVMNDPAWVAHLDCDALRQTAIGKQLLVELNKPEEEKKFAAFQAIFNVDPRKDLHGVTLYSATKAEPDGVVLAYAEFDADRLVTLVEANKDYESTMHGAHKIHSWIDEKKKSKDGSKPRTYGAIHKGKVIVLGQKESRVAAALDVLDRRQPGLTGSSTFAQLGADAGFLIGAARALDLPGNDPGAAVLKQAKMIWLSAREAQGRAELKLNLDLASADAARQVGDVCRGLVAVMSLQTDKPEAIKLAKAISIEQEAAGIVAKLSLPAADVVQMIQEGAAKKAAKE